MAVSSSTAISMCVLTASLYVSSLYVGSFLFGTRTGGSRDDPAVVRRRFAGVTVACAVAPFVVTATRGKGETGSRFDTPLWTSLGLRTDNLIAAGLYPLLLTATLFLGPLLMWALELSDKPTSTLHNNPAVQTHETTDGKSHAMEEDEKEILGRAGPIGERSWWGGMRHTVVALASDILVWRNLVVAPVTEEFVFRACIGEILRQGGFSTRDAVLICPVFFAVAHLHHFWDLVYYQRQPVVLAVLTLVLQMTYTTLFGWYAALLLVRTGHLLCPIVAHVFCNVMGFPDLGAIPRHPHRRVVSAAFVLGLTGFVYLLGNRSLVGLLFE